MIEIDDEQFNKVQSSTGLVIVDFYAQWCYPCKMLTNVLQELENENSTVIYKINIEKHQKNAKKFKISSIPTICVFFDGEYKECIVGYKHKDELKKILSKYD